jgi:ubiquinone/menaquinone biosynthesis C-methylase UbiE
MKQEREFYEKTGSKYDALISGSVFQHFANTRKTFLRSIPFSCKNPVILDLGCGTGIYQDAFIDRDKLIGLDYSFSALKSFRTKDNRVKLINSDARAIPVKNESVDIVIAFGLVHHLYLRIDMVFSEIRRVLKKDGFFIIDEPNGRNPLWRLLFRSWIARRIDGEFSKLLYPRRIKKYLKKAGLIVCDEQYWSFTPPSFNGKSDNWRIINTIVSPFSVRYLIIGKRNK